MTRLIRYGAAAVLAAALAGLPAGTRGGHAAASAAPSASAMTDEQILAIARHPDPAKLDAAFNACESIVDVLPPGVMSGPWVSAADLEKTGRFAACLRQHGFPEWPDPNGDGLFAIRGTALESALRSDQGQEATKACQKYYDGTIKTVNP
jgi:hypothetical protein